MLELQTCAPTRINAQIVAAPKEMGGREAIRYHNKIN